MVRSWSCTWSNWGGGGGGGNIRIIVESSSRGLVLEACDPLTNHITSRLLACWSMISLHAFHMELLSLL